MKLLVSGPALVSGWRGAQVEKSAPSQGSWRTEGLRVPGRPLPEALLRGQDTGGIVHVNTRLPVGAGRVWNPDLKSLSLRDGK